MQKTQDALLVALTLTLTLIAGRASGEPCKTSVAAVAPSARTIVLAGGDPWTLFRRFVREVQERSLDVSLWNAQVRISRSGQVETLSLGWAKRLSGDSAPALWQRSLRGRPAEIDPRLLSEAAAARWDVVCEGQVPETEPPPPPVPQKTVRSPSDALPYFKNGLQYAARRDYRNAVKELRAAERIDPRFHGLWTNLGAAYLQLRDYANADDSLRRALEQDPGDATAHYNLACLHALRGERERAVDSLRRAKENGLQLTRDERRDPDLASLRGRRDFESLFE